MKKNECSNSDFSKQIFEYLNIYPSSKMYVHRFALCILTTEDSVSHSNGVKPSFLAVSHSVSLCMLPTWYMHKEMHISAASG